MINLEAYRLGMKKKRTNEKDRSWYHSQWLALLSKAPGEGISSLRKKLPGVHWWLKTHDMQWLLAHRPLSRSHQKPRNHFPVSLGSHQEFICNEQESSWDGQIATSVRICAKRITNATGYPKRVTMRKLSIEIPELRRIRTKEAPLTRLALQEVLETPETFALRRIQWLVQKCRKERIVLKRRQFIKIINIDQTLHIPCVRDAFEEAMSMITSLE